MEGKLIKVNDIYTLMVNDKMFASNDEDFQKDYEVDKLSFKNCQAIENGYYLDELAKEEHKYNPRSINEMSFRLGFEVGFQKAIEILGDKKFSEEQMKRIYEKGYSSGRNELNSRESDKVKYDYIQSLQKTEWDCIIEMECPQCKEFGYISECRNNCNQKFLQPKLDENGCLILKRK